MPNPWKLFQELVNPPVRFIGQVVSHNGDGTSLLQLPEGGLISVRGQDVSVGGFAFAKDGKIDGQAPSYTAVVEFDI